MMNNSYCVDVSFLEKRKLSEEDLKQHLISEVIVPMSSVFGCYSDWYNQASLLVRIYTKKNFDVYEDKSFNGLAAIDFRLRRVILNEDVLKQTLVDNVLFVLFNRDVFNFLFSRSKNNKLLFNLYEYVNYFTCYLMLHELGHYFYTVDNKIADKYITFINKQKHIPKEFAHFVINVVEDSFIQRKFQLDYPIQIYRDYFLLGTSIIQGPASALTWVEALKQAEQSQSKFMKIYDKLFYFILRAYNLNDKDIQEVYGKSPVLGWTDKCLEYFDTAICILDNEKRCEYTCNTLLPELFDVLHEVVNVTKQQMQNNGNGSLLDEDKLREANIVEESEDEDTEDESNLEESSGTCDSNSSKSSSKSDSNSDSESEDGESECDDEAQNQGNSEEELEDDNLSDDEAENDSSSNSEADSSNENEDDEESEDGEDNEGSSDEEVSSSEDNSTGDSSDSQPKADAGKTIEEQMQELEDAFNQELKEACDELNASLDESKDRSYDKVDSKTFNQDVSINDIADIINEINCNYKVANDLESFIKNQKNSSLSTISTYGVNLFNIAGNLFKRIYTFDTDDLNYLDNGELDEDTMLDFYTEKSLNIFKQHRDLVESKNIRIFFLVDDSGSMYTERAKALRVIIPPLMHAFEESNIETCLYAFGSRCYLVKDFKDKIFLSGADSSLQYVFNKVYDSGSTNISPALSAISCKDFDDDTIYIMFVFTDGYVDNENLASDLFKYLSKVKKVNLFGVTIDDTYACETLMHLMNVNEEACKNYTTDELITKLPQDIYSTIVDKFIKK